MSAVVWVALALALAFGGFGVWVISRNRTRRELAKYELREHAAVEAEATSREESVRESVDAVVSGGGAALEEINTRHDERAVDLTNVDSFEGFVFRRE